MNHVRNNVRHKTYTRVYLVWLHFVVSGNLFVCFLISVTLATFENDLRGKKHAIWITNRFRRKKIHQMNWVWEKVILQLISAKMKKRALVIISFLIFSKTKRVHNMHIQSITNTDEMYYLSKCMSITSQYGYHSKNGDAAQWDGHKYPSYSMSPWWILIFTILIR